MSHKEFWAVDLRNGAERALTDLALIELANVRR